MHYCIEKGENLGKVTVYTAEGCNKCEILKEKLQQKNIKFETASSVGKLIKLGFKSAPVLEIGDLRMDYGDAVKWVNSVNKER